MCIRQADEVAERLSPTISFLDMELEILADDLYDDVFIDLLREASPSVSNIIDVFPLLLLSTATIYDHYQLPSTTHYFSTNHLSLTIKL